MESCNDDSELWQNKVGLIEGTITKPNTEGSLLSVWYCNNNIIASWIPNSDSKEIAASIVYNGSVEEIYRMNYEIILDKASGCKSINSARNLSHSGRVLYLLKPSYCTKLETIWQNLIEFRLVDECFCGGLKPTNHFLNTWILNMWWYSSWDLMKHKRVSGPKSC